MRTESLPPPPPLATKQSPPATLSTTPDAKSSSTATESGQWFDTGNPEMMEKVVESINSFLQSLKRNLEFSVDQDTGRPIIKVWDAEHEELIRQIPPDETLRLVEHFLDGNGIQTTGLTDKA
ncbi:flagellar protein FlaG [Thiospirillum jenense]|uniref:Flagellar protein FlaG n=2 Tax=Thiospirillum jenense TaxID=1653858 RepID=A0A839HER0_9GAMM|nr:flagellar protein FlaG [Thiospirillum jenense]